MMPALKAEFRKVLTVRSTYVIFALALIFVAFFAGYIEGFRTLPDHLQNPSALSEQVTAAVQAMSIFGALIALLLFAHEYRYNTIMHTLTLSNSRTKVLVAKLITVSVVAVIFTLAIGIFSPIAASVGLHVKGVSLVPQTFHYGDLLWRCLFFGWGYAMLGLLLIALIRNQIGAIVALFIIPSTIDPILTVLLKQNAVYLPFSALGQVLGGGFGSGHLTPGRAVSVYLGYLIAGWIIAWVLFLRRDAN